MKLSYPAVFYFSWYECKLQLYRVCPGRRFSAETTRSCMCINAPETNCMLCTVQYHYIDWMNKKYMYTPSCCKHKACKHTICFFFVYFYFVLLFCKLNYTVKYFESQWLNAMRQLAKLKLIMSVHSFEVPSQAAMVQ